MKTLTALASFLLAFTLLSGCVLVPGARPPQVCNNQVYYAPYANNYYYGTPYFRSNNYYSRNFPYFYRGYNYNCRTCYQGVAIDRGCYGYHCHYINHHHYRHHYRHHRHCTR